MKSEKNHFRENAKPNSQANQILNMIRHIANINTSKSTGKRREEKIAIIREPAGNLQKYMKLKSHAELKFVNSRWGCGVFAQ